jgi:hypothetical protein
MAPKGACNFACGGLDDQYAFEKRVEVQLTEYTMPEATMSL